MAKAEQINPLYAPNPGVGDIPYPAESLPAPNTNPLIGAGEPVTVSEEQRAAAAAKWEDEQNKMFAEDHAAART